MNHSQREKGELKKKKIVELSPDTRRAVLEKKETNVFSGASVGRTRTKR